MGFCCHFYSRPKAKQPKNIHTYICLYVYFDAVLLYCKNTPRSPWLPLSQVGRSELRPTLVYQTNMMGRGWQVCMQTWDGAIELDLNFLGGTIAWVSLWMTDCWQVCLHVELEWMSRMNEWVSRVIVYAHVSVEWIHLFTHSVKDCHMKLMEQNSWKMKILFL